LVIGEKGRGKGKPGSSQLVGNLQEKKTKRRILIKRGRNTTHLHPFGKKKGGVDVVNFISTVKRAGRFTG